MKHTLKLALLSLCAFAQEVNGASLLSRFRAGAAQQATALKTLVGARIFTRTASRLVQPTTTARSITSVPSAGKFSVPAFRAFFTNSDNNNNQKISRNWSIWGLTPLLGFFGYETRTEDDIITVILNKKLLENSNYRWSFYDLFNAAEIEFKKSSKEWPLNSDTLKKKIAMSILDRPEITDKNIIDEFTIDALTSIIEYYNGDDSDLENSALVRLYDKMFTLIRSKEHFGDPLYYDKNKAASHNYFFNYKTRKYINAGYKGPEFLRAFVLLPDYRQKELADMVLSRNNIARELGEYLQPFSPDTKSAYYYSQPDPKENLTK